MKKRPEITKEQIKKEIRFIRRGPIKLRKHKKLINGKVTKEDLVMLLSSLWSNLGKLTFKVPTFDEFGYYILNKKNEIVYEDKRKYKNIMPFGRFNKYPRKILAGIYGSTLQIARKEGLV